LIYNAIITIIIIIIFIINNIEVNARLPEDVVRLKNCSSRTGRVTFASNAMNNGAGAEATSVATKHRDPKTLLGYVAADDRLLMEAALTIGNIIHILILEEEQIIRTKNKYYCRTKGSG
jgi:hypothetical protein